jgi:hypothetical protein
LGNEEDYDKYIEAMKEDGACFSDLEFEIAALHYNNTIKLYSPHYKAANLLKITLPSANSFGRKK